MGVRSSMARSCHLLTFLLSILASLTFSTARPEMASELKDDGDGLTGPQPSVIGSVDKVFKQVNKFDQYQCLQKIICEFMGTAGDSVVNTISNNFGPQTGQLTQQNLQQFASNPNQFVQTFPNQVSSGFSNQLGNNQVFQNGQQFLNNGQQFVQSGQQFVQTGQQLVQGQFPNQFSQFQNGQFQTQFAQPSQFVPQQTQFVPQQTQFVPQQSQFVQQQQSQGSGFGLGDIASTLLSALGKKRRKRQTTMHGQAIRLMQNLGLSNMGAYPFVRAAILGHANRRSPGSCRQQYSQCPSETSLLLNYFNNHNGGLFQNTLPTATNEVGNLFPGINNLPQIAASTFGSGGTSSSGSSGDGLLDNFVDSLAGAIAQATLGR